MNTYILWMPFVSVYQISWNLNDNETETRNYFETHLINDTAENPNKLPKIPEILKIFSLILLDWFSVSRFLISKENALEYFFKSFCFLYSIIFLLFTKYDQHFLNSSRFDMK